MNRAPRSPHHGPGVSGPVRHDPVRQDPVRQDPGHQDPVHHDPGRDEPLSHEPLRDDPLRGLAKSMMRCGLAMGLMGWEAAMGSAPGSAEVRRRRFDDAAHAAEAELGEYLGEVYRAGVRAGDRMIDGMAELGAGTPLDPRRFARAIADLAERTGDTLDSLAGRPPRESSGRDLWREPDDGAPGRPPERGSEAGRWP